MGYNNADGSSYVTIKDNTSTPTAAAAASSAVVTEGAPAANPQTKPPQSKAHARRLFQQPPGSNTTTNKTRAGVQHLARLFEAATKGNYSDEQWVKASASKTDATGWRRLITWHFGEDGGVFRMTKDGSAIYVVSSLGR